MRISRKILTRREDMCHKTLGMLIIFFIIEISAYPYVFGDVPKPGGELVIALETEPSTLNHAIQSGSTTGIIGTQIFAGLLRFDANWNPHPYLAEQWELSEDGLSLTLHLAKNAAFHDGRPVTSEDVAFSLMVVKKYHPFNTMFKAVDRVDTPDPHTAVIRLSHPHPVIILCMSPILLPIIPKHIYGDGRDIMTHPANMAPVGSGPFKFAEYIPGKQLVLERYDKFFIKERPYLDRIYFKFYTGVRGDIFLELGRQTIHLAPYMVNTGFGADELARSPHLVITDKGYQAAGPINWLAFNLKQKPFDDIRVRRAFAYTIDRDYIVRELYKGRAKAATGPITLKSPFYSADVEHYQTNIQKANKLLDTAGYPRDERGIRFTVTLDCFPDASSGALELAQYLRYDLARKIGVQIKLRTFDREASWMQQISSWDFQITLDSVCNWGDPVIGVHRTYDSRNIRKGVIWSNTQQYSNPKVDALLDAAAAEQDIDKRKALYREFQKIILEDLPVYPLIIAPYVTIYHQNLMGIEDNIWGVLAPFDNIYWKK